MALTKPIMIPKMCAISSLKTNFRGLTGAGFAQVDVDENPFHKLHLEGHKHAVRALAARGRTAVSGSYDTTIRIWDIITGTCQWVLAGHTQKGWHRSNCLDSLLV
jgi:WD40 repeat protein